MLIQKERDFYQDIESDIEKKAMPELNFKKFRATCSNAVEQYEYIKKGRRQQVFIQKIRGAFGIDQRKC